MQAGGTGERPAAGDELFAQLPCPGADTGRGLHLGEPQFAVQLRTGRQRRVGGDDRGGARQGRAGGGVEEQELLLDADGQAGGSGRVAGPWITEPSVANRDPWHAQSQVFSALLKATTQPRWVHSALTSRSCPSSPR